MTNLPKEFKFLDKETAPKILVEALKLYGTKEVAGKGNNADILKWAKEVGLNKTYTADEIPWCGLYIAYVVHKAGLSPVENPLWALNWKKWGTAQKTAMLGDILVFKRTTSTGASAGHVGVYVAESADHYYVLGGNQSDSVNIAKLAKNRCVGIRRTTWKIAQPKNVRQIFINSSQKLSTNEE